MQSVSHQAALANAQGNLDSAKGKYSAPSADSATPRFAAPSTASSPTARSLPARPPPPELLCITVMDTSALIAKLHIAQMQAQQLEIGAPATLTVPGVAGPVPAKVSLISPALDPGSTTVEVWLRVENARGSLKAGTPVNASIQGRTICQRAHRSRGCHPEQPGRKL